MTPNPKTCGAIGCTDSADVVVKIPEKGRRTVCSECANGYQVVANV